MSASIVEVRAAWWLWPYLHTLVFFCWLMCGEPDEEKLMRMIVRGMRWRFCGARRWNKF